MDFFLETYESVHVPFADLKVTFFRITPIQVESIESLYGSNIEFVELTKLSMASKIRRTPGKRTRSSIVDLGM